MYHRIQCGCWIRTWCCFQAPFKFQCFVCASSALNNVEICRSIGESIFLLWNVALLDTVLSLCYTEAHMKIKLKLNFWVKPCWPLADTTLVKYSSCKSFIRNIKKNNQSLFWKCVQTFEWNPKVSLSAKFVSFGLFVHSVWCAFDKAGCLSPLTKSETSKMLSRQTALWDPPSGHTLKVFSWMYIFWLVVS